MHYSKLAFSPVQSLVLSSFVSELLCVCVYTNTHTKLRYTQCSLERKLAFTVNTARSRILWRGEGNKAKSAFKRTLALTKQTHFSIKGRK